jgi:acylglycerol lipase
MRETTETFDGVGTPLFARCWHPAPETWQAPRAVVVITHGYGEHSGRYAPVAAALTAAGYAVCAQDHQGHGLSGGPRARIDRFDDYVRDLARYVDRVRAEFPGLPVFVYGHSMGALIALLLDAEHQDDLAGLIVTGVALRIAGANRLMAFFVRLANRAYPQGRALVPALDSRSLSRDPAVVAAYDGDPLVYRQRTCVKWAGQMLWAIKATEDCLPALRLPLLALHGGADALTRPAGVELVRALSGSPDTTVKIYDGLYHEIHNEPERDQVLADIVAWLDAHLP